MKCSKRKKNRKSRITDLKKRGLYGKSKIKDSAYRAYKPNVKLGGQMIDPRLALSHMAALLSRGKSKK